MTKKIIMPMTHCKLCKKKIPDEINPIGDPCTCRDYREQFARAGKIIHPVTKEAFIHNYKPRQRG